MRAKLITILTALALVLSAPLMAQTYQEEEPLNEQERLETETAVEGDVDVDADADLDGDLDDDEFGDEDFDDELPRTASPLALLALLGVGGAGSALGLRLARRK